MFAHLSSANWGFPGASDGKESVCIAGDPSLIPGSGRSPGEVNATLVFLPGEFHGQRSLAGYSSWGHKESNALSTCTHSQARYLVHLHFKITR